MLERRRRIAARRGTDGSRVHGGGARTDERDGRRTARRGIDRWTRRSFTSPRTSRDRGPQGPRDFQTCDKPTPRSRPTAATPSARAPGPLDGYTIKRAIGRGGFGEVYYATSDSGKEVALKLILRNLDVERRGVMQCMNLKCPNLLTIYDLKTNDAGDTFVVMEYVAGPSLASVLKQYPERDAAGRGPPLAQGAGRGRGLSPRPRDRPPRPEAGQPVHGGGDRQDRRLRPGQADHAQPGDRALREHRDLPLHGPRDRLGQVQQADRRLRHRRDPLRDAHRPGAVRRRDGQRGADEAPDGPARRLDAAPSRTGRSWPRRWPRTRTSGRPGSTTCCRPGTRRGSRRSGSSARARPAAARGRLRPAGARRRRTSCGSRPRSRCSTSGPRPGRPAGRGRPCAAARGPACAGARCGTPARDGAAGREGARKAMREAGRARRAAR